VSTDLGTQAVEAWEINARLNLYLLEAVPDEDLSIQLAKGKRVSGQFAHVHNVRLMWLKSAGPDLLEGLTKIDDGATKAEVAAALTSSGAGVAELLRRAYESDGKVKGFKPHATAFLGYLIAHEANHRGQVEVALRQAGKPLTDKIGYGMWEWGVR
jgi:uncharacterized damage-inducible protein DinB